MSYAFSFVYIYHSPNSEIVKSISFINVLENQIAINVNNRPLCLMGDFNITKIDWSIHCKILNHTSVGTKLLLFSQRAGLK